MPKTQIIPLSNQVKKFVDSLTHHILESHKNILQACKILADLKNDDDPDLFPKVRDELMDKKILSRSAIYGYATIGEFGNGFFLKNQNKIPLAYTTLLSIAEEVKSDSQMKRLENAIAKGLINRSTQEKHLYTILNLEKSVPKKDPQIGKQPDEDKDPNKLKIIEISVDRDILHDKQDDIIKHVNTIKKMMKYASVKEVKRLKENIDNEFKT